VAFYSKKSGVSQQKIWQKTAKKFFELDISLFYAV
jgi:hypothetical protein